MGVSSTSRRRPPGWRLEPCDLFVNGQVADRQASIPLGGLTILIGPAEQPAGAGVSSLVSGPPRTDNGRLRPLASMHDNLVCGSFPNVETPTALATTSTRSMQLPIGRQSGKLRR